MNARAGVLTVLAGALSVCIAAASPASAEDPGSRSSLLKDEGRKLFESHCAACHGLYGKGNGPVAEALTPKPSDLTTLEARRGSSLSWGEVAMKIDGRAKVAAHGPGDMPVWGTALHRGTKSDGFREEEIRGDLAALVEFLKSVQVKPPV